MGEDAGHEASIFFLAVTLAVGTFFHHYLHNIRLPYTMLMFVFGMIAGAISLAVPDAPYFQLYEVPPRVVFHTFLPILIFEGAHSMKIHAFKTVFWQTIWLAGPGLIINSLITAGALLLMFDWNVYTALLLGSILSATDPVAVVALLKDLGVNKYITAMVDGESILNDGTAIIAFVLFLPAATTNSIDASAAAIGLQCIRLTLGGVAFGLFCGMVQSVILHRCHEEIVFVVANIAMTFMSFYIADELLETSGVLTLCFEGTYLSYSFPSVFPGKGGTLFNHTWELLVHVANTILFALVGLIIVRDALPGASWANVGHIIFLYLVLVVARLAMILILKPLLNRHTCKLDLPTVMLLVHGGLRGGVATVLALMVDRDESFPRGIGNTFLILTCGIVFITTTVNAPTAKLVVAYLKLDRTDENRVTQMEHGMRHIRESRQRNLASIKRGHFVSSVNWGVVTGIGEKVSNPYDGVEVVEQPSDAAFRIILMRMFKRAVWNMRDAKEIAEFVARVLCHKANTCIAARTLLTTEDLHEDIVPPIYLRVSRAPVWFLEDRLQSLRMDFDRHVFGLMTAFVDALNAVDVALEKFYPSALERSAAHEWLQRERSKTLALVNHWFKEKANAATQVATDRASHQLLNQSLGDIECLKLHHGFSLGLLRPLAGSVNDAINSVKAATRRIDPPTLAEVLRISPLGSAEVPQFVIGRLSTVCELRRFDAGVAVPLAGFAAIVVSGSLRLARQTNVERGVGDAVGLAAVASPAWVPPRCVAGSGGAQVALVSIAQLHVTAKLDAPFFQRLWFAAATEIAAAQLPETSRFSGIDGPSAAMLVATLGDILRADPSAGYPGIDPPESDDVTIFLCGSDASGVLGQTTRPLILPSNIKFEWQPGTALLRLSLAASTDRVQARAMGADSIATVGGRGTPGAAQEGLSGTARFGASVDETGARHIEMEMRAHGFGSSPRRCGVPQDSTYDPAKCVVRTRPRLNELQLRFLAQHEELDRARLACADADDGLAGDTPDETRTSATLHDAVHRTMHFLSRLCVMYFALEAASIEEIMAAEGVPSTDGPVAEADKAALMQRKQELVDKIVKSRRAFLAQTNAWLNAADANDASEDYRTDNETSTDDLPAVILAGLSDFERYHMPLLAELERTT